ncbi:leucine-rich repeat-containing protein 15 [Diachasma alloeum]|uniref:leucine-rich repeat-containing protein 15 n=1 Tax=Diachasma alloeum TaxID=454923 RepID=UPI0007383076|nr:leucine-rich repeat-containing protein 15 [Diachasma alloeum]
MKLLIGLNLIILVSSVFEEGEVCRRVDDDLQVCSKSDTLTGCVDENSPPRGELTLELADESKTTIGRHALSNLSISSLWIEGPWRRKDVKPSLSLLPESFAGLTSLKRLSLRRVLINFNDGSALAPLGLLEKLEVERSNLTEVPRDVLAFVPNLRSLSLSNNQIRDVRPNSFAALKHLEVLDLTENGITGIRPGAFETADLAAGLPRLRELRMPFNRIESIPKGVFEKLKRLRTLDISGNKIGVITPGAFGRLILDELTLASNDIGVIETETFNGLSALRLVLNANRIVELKPGAFRGFVTEVLDLSFNRLRRIGVDDFAGFSTDCLKLSFNDIGIVDRGALNNTVGKRLEIYGNKGIADSLRKADLGLSESVELLSKVALE